MEKLQNNLKIQNIVSEIIKKAKSKKVIKPITSAFKDIPVKEEKHQGKKEYFN